MSDSLTVVIPTYNGLAHLQKVLPALKRQSIDFELLIVDSSSTDGTEKLIEKYADRIITIAPETFDHGGTRTLAAQEAEGEIVVFLTQDALPVSSDTVETLVQAFEDEGIWAAYGRQLPYTDASLFAKHLRLFNYPPRSRVKRYADRKELGLKTPFLSDSFAAYRKSRLAEVGWFKDGLIFGEDMHIAARILIAGGHIAYVAEAQVYHSHDYTVTEDFRRYFDMGVFHTQESWILEHFGVAEGRGSEYVMSELKYLIKKKAWPLLPQWFARNGMKLAGYKLGRRYKTFPESWLRIMTSQPKWWDKVRR